MNTTTVKQVASPYPQAAIPGTENAITTSHAPGINVAAPEREGTIRNQSLIFSYTCRVCARKTGIRVCEMKIAYTTTRRFSFPCRCPADEKLIARWKISGVA